MLAHFFKEMLALYPSFASFLGSRKSDSRVEISISPMFLRQWKKLLHKYKRLLHNKSSLSLDDKILSYIVNSNIESLRYKTHLAPVSSFSNPVLEFTFMEKTIYPNNKHNRILRHKCYIQYITQAISNMKQGIKEAYVIPQRICLQVIADIDNFINTKGYVCNKDITEFLEQEYKPQLVQFNNFLKNTYLKHCSQTIACKDKALYLHLVKSNTTLNITPEQVHQLGLSEVARIKKEIMKFADNDESLVEFMTSIQSNKNNYFKTGEEVIDAYRQKQADIRKTIIPTYFYDQVQSYEIKPVPKMLEASAAGAFFYPGNMKRPGRFYINLRNVKENPRYTIETLAIHEGEPGHHYQYQYMLERNIPKHRIFACDGTAFAEGWALYAESLSMSKNKIDNFGRLTFEMFRAVRCVVDTGIHMYGWTFERALNYMKEHLAMAESELVTEIERYICIPGQAVAYKVGEQFLLKQREKFLKTNGNTIKEFHKRVLENGVIPLCVMEEIMQPS